MFDFPLTINLYLIKSFLKRLFYVLISISLLIFVINLFDSFNKVRYVSHVTNSQVLTMALLQIPPFLADIAIFIILLSAMLTLFNLSSKSEITVMRSSGMSLWDILWPIIFTSFILGLVFIFAFLPLTISANKKYTQMEQELIKKQPKDSFAPKNGIWLRQENRDNPKEEIKIRAEKIYKNNLELTEVTIWLVDRDNKFYRKIDVKNMQLVKGEWHLKSAIINDQNNVNKAVDQMIIKTDLEPEFILQKIINNFEDVKLFSVLDLPKLIKNMEESGFSSRKFKVYFNALLNYPLLFVCMTIMAAYFSINNIRNRNNALFIVSGIIFGLITYIGLNILNALGSSGILPSFMSTWLITILFLAISIILVFKKESVG